MNCKIINKRLKELRESKKLSHEKLAKELTKMYGGKGQNEHGKEKYRLSRQILIDYENKDRVNGMSIDTLNMLSDFYNVSTDYILGLTNIKTSNTTIKEICEITGLNEESIKSLERLKQTILKDFEPIKWLNKFLNYKNGG